MDIRKALFVWLFSFSLFYNKINAQQYDKVWILGTPMASMTFDSDTIISSQLPDSTISSFITIGDICDVNGNLLFYTNGVNVYNIQGNIMVNGDTLSAPSEYYDQILNGMPSQEGVVILPMPEDSNLYYIFHYTATDTLDPYDAGYEPLFLYYSIVDMRQDSGRGAVVQKNVPLIKDVLLSASRLAACRHANGRDWWLVKNVWHKNIYYEFLITPNGIEGPFIQQIGPLYGLENELGGYAAFSPDGTKYASVTQDSYVVIMDFDRCTGLFSNPDSLYDNKGPTDSPSISGAVSLAFSPDSRFLYTTFPYVLNQFDLSTFPIIPDSVRIQTDTEFYGLNIIQQAPNGNIYISCWNGGSYALHVINQPDSLGLACDYQFLGQSTTTQSPVALPYFPNFRLGPLVGSGCDTLTEIQTIADAHPAFATVTPNPASDRAEIIYYTGSNTANQAMMYDITGRQDWSADVSGSAGNINMNLASFPAGIYMVRFIAGDHVLLNSKLVVMR